MRHIEEPQTENLQAELSVLRQEKTYLASAIKANALESGPKLEAMIRYSVVIAEIRALVGELRELGSVV